MKNFFIVNKAARSGNAVQIWEEIAGYLSDNEIEYEVFFTERKSHATELASMLTSKGQEINLFVMGGDGTLNEALNGIKDFENTYYCPLPSGSANDFVNGINLEGSALEILKRAINCDTPKVIDIGQVKYDGGSRLFGVSAGIGVDAFVCLQAETSTLKKILNKIKMGSATYGLLTVGDIFSMPLADATIIHDGVEKKIKDCVFAAAMNCPAEGGGIKMVPYAKADSGKLSAFVAHDISRLRCFCLLPFLVAGKHENKKGFDFIDFTKMEIKLAKPMCVHADGEHVGFFDYVEYSCLKESLKIKGF